MRYCLQYHNGCKLGWVPLDEQPFLNNRPSIYTRRAWIERAIGATVFLIVSLGEPRRYYLWETFRIEKVQRKEEGFYADGPGWQLMPPQLLDGEAFETFRRACGNFIGFACIDDLPYHLVLDDLSRRFRREGLTPDVEPFCGMLMGAFPESGVPQFARGYARRRLGNVTGAREDLNAALLRKTGLEEAIRQELRELEQEG